MSEQGRIAGRMRSIIYLFFGYFIHSFNFALFSYITNAQSGHRTILSYEWMNVSQEKRERKKKFLALAQGSIKYYNSVFFSASVTVNVYRCCSCFYWCYVVAVDDDILPNTFFLRCSFYICWNLIQFRSVFSCSICRPHFSVYFFIFWPYIFCFKPFVWLFQSLHVIWCS